MNVRTLIRSLPVIGPLSKRVFNLIYVPSKVSFNSGEYWDARYKTGGNSGAGSYNRLAEFKAEIISNFISRERIRSVIEFGCGDGAQLRLIEYPVYIGVDVSQTILAKVGSDYSDRPNYKFLHTSEVSAATKAELGLSLDVIYHLIEDAVFEAYMNSLFDAAEKAVIIYASNEDKAWTAPHVRHRKFTDWVEKNRPDFVLMSHVPNRYPYDTNDLENTSFADFFIYTRTG